jgi:hypothetical protein
MPQPHLRLFVSFEPPFSLDLRVLCKLFQLSTYVSPKENFVKTALERG